MPKKRKKYPDQHTSAFLVRLPESYREKLKELKRLTDRPVTASVRRGVDAELRANGIEPPASEE